MTSVNNGNGVYNAALINDSHECDSEILPNPSA